MSRIIVVFPKKEIAVNIRNLLVRNGIDVMGIGTTGAQAMQYADTLDDGIIVCGYQLPDMMYTELREYLPDTFEILLIASAGHWMEGGETGVVGLSMPVKVYDLLNTVDMMMQTLASQRRKKKEHKAQRTEEQQKRIDEAKQLLIARNNMSEEEAHRYLQKSSMDTGTGLAETAEMILSIMSE